MFRSHRPDEFLFTDVEPGSVVVQHYHGRHFVCGGGVVRDQKVSPYTFVRSGTEFDQAAYISVSMFGYDGFHPECSCRNIVPAAAEGSCHCCYDDCSYEGAGRGHGSVLFPGGYDQASGGKDEQKEQGH